MDMDAPLYSRPALVEDALYLATAHRLYSPRGKALIHHPGERREALPPAISQDGKGNQRGPVIIGTE
jgi:hypothetical protein